MSEVKWVELFVNVTWDDGTTEDVAAQLPQYLMGEIVAHINEIEARRNGRLPQ